jgi:hypothetical protein
MSINAFVAQAHLLYRQTHFVLLLDAKNASLHDISLPSSVFNQKILDWDG